MATGLNVIAVDPGTLGAVPDDVDDDPLEWLWQAPGTRVLAQFRSRGAALDEVVTRMTIAEAHRSWIDALVEERPRTIESTPPGLARVVEAERWVVVDHDGYAALVEAVERALAADPDWARDPIEGFGPDWARLVDTPVNEPIVVWAH